MYKESFLDRMGQDGLTVLRAGVWSVPITLLAGTIAAAHTLEQGSGGWSAAGSAILAGLAAFIFIIGGTLVVTGGAADAAMRILWPSGRSTAAPPAFSLQEAMVARGDVPGAIASFEALFHDPKADWRISIAARLRAADLYASRAGDPRRARDLFEEARAHPRASAAQDLTATNRLVDLYLGPLDDPEAARTELGRIVARHPESTAAAHARAVLGKC